MIKTKSKIISQDNDMTKTLKKNIFPNPTHFPVHCDEKRYVNKRKKIRELRKYARKKHSKKVRKKTRKKKR